MNEADVRAAKVAFLSQLGRPEWLRGVGIGKDGLGYFIKVNSSEPLPEGLVKTSFNGVRIIVDVVGDIRALKRPREHKA